MNIGKIIRKYRKEMGITQEEMAARLGVTTPAVNKWENGNTLPDIGLVAPIARLLEISTDELLQKPYWVIDILPEQVPRESKGQFFEILLRNRMISI
ncbi:helix-turn-helix domain-containing protein [Butyrivibrio sp. LC3010]|uniref:helix-turn-helix domain-containing protein n=1 Tax=Butyrivibrio sp. LC3010 TaxID=1280680 RepID=UPI0003FDD413|nr:helix-turn-helix transcriptional regulator [Butyrivibrio sp. LC3010]